MEEQILVIVEGSNVGPVNELLAQGYRIMYGTFHTINGNTAVLLTRYTPTSELSTQVSFDAQPETGGLVSVARYYTSVTNGVG